MNRHDLPPGHKLFRFRREEWQVPNDLEPGDVFVERGPRIGERWWQATVVEACVKLDHVACRPVADGELVALVLEVGHHRVFRVTR